MCIAYFWTHVHSSLPSSDCLSTDTACMSLTDHLKDVHSRCISYIDAASLRPSQAEGKVLRRLRRCIARSQAQQENLQLFSPSKVMYGTMPLQLVGLVPISASERNSCLQINLFLRVMRRRDDGYHDLASLFHVSPGSILLCLKTVANSQDHRPRRTVTPKQTVPIPLVK